jgi:hypothetical protein
MNPDGSRRSTLGSRIQGYGNKKARRLAGFLTYGVAES